MPDVTIISPTEVGGRFYPAANTNGPVWTDANTGYFFYTRHLLAGNAQLYYKKTTDSFVTVGSEVTVTSLDGSFGIWFDKWTSGDTGDLIHLVSMNAAGVSYTNLGTTDDTSLTAIPIFNFTLGHSGDWNSKQLSITKARGGNLYCAAAAVNIGLSTMVESVRRSVDGGVNWTDRAQLVETNPTTPMDYAILVPGNEADDQDIWAVYWDVSADELSLKVYDDSANTWTETSIATGMAEHVAGQFYQLAATTRHSDNHMIVAAWSALSTATTDLRIWDINGSGSITEKTNVLTNSDQTGMVGIMVNQQTDDIYVAYAGDPAETFFVTIKIRYKISTDGGDNWGSAVVFSEAAASNNRAVWCPLSVGNEGGRFIIAWPDQTATASYETNSVNSIEIASAGGSPVAISAQLGMQQRELLLL